MRDQPLVHNIKIRYYKSHHKPREFMKRKTIDTVLLILTVIIIALLWIFGERK